MVSWWLTGDAFPSDSFSVAMVQPTTGKWKRKFSIKLNDRRMSWLCYTYYFLNFRHWLEHGDFCWVCISRWKTKQFSILLEDKYMENSLSTCRWLLRWYNVSPGTAMSLMIAFGVASAEILKCLDDSIDAVASMANKFQCILTIWSAELIYCLHETIM